MGELIFGGGEGGGGVIKIWWSQVEGMSKLGAGGKGLPQFFPVGKPIYIYIYIIYIYIYYIYIIYIYKLYIYIYIYIYTTVLGYVLIPLANHN